MEPRELCERILAADTGLTVDDILEQDLLNQVPDGFPDGVGDAFRALSIVWGPDRAWGEEAILGKDETITLGHRRGHHIASHPEWVGYSPDDAAGILLTEVEGTLLHELGHAVLRLALAEKPALRADLRGAIEADGPVTEYQGHADAKRDGAHEQFAEAFRWWVSGGDDFVEHFPAWGALISETLDAIADWQA